MDGPIRLNIVVCWCFDKLSTNGAFFEPGYATFNMILPITVLYAGQPLAGAYVKLNNLDFDARPVATATTDAHGSAVFTVPFKGLWQMNVVWTKPIRDTKADFDTVFSSLTFGWSRATATGH